MKLEAISGATLRFDQSSFTRVVCFDLLSRMYIKHGNPVKMMEAYIAVLTKGICQSDENGSFLIKDYDVRKAYLAGSVKGETWFHFDPHTARSLTQCCGLAPDVELYVKKQKRMVRSDAAESETELKL